MLSLSNSRGNVVVEDSFEVELSQYLNDGAIYGMLSDWTPELLL